MGDLRALLGLVSAGTFSCWSRRGEVIKNTKPWRESRLAYKEGPGVKRARGEKGGPLYPILRGRRGGAAPRSWPLKIHKASSLSLRVSL